MAKDLRDTFSSSDRSRDADQGRKRPTHKRKSDQPKVSKGKKTAAFAAGGAVAVAASAAGKLPKKKKGKRRIAFKPIRRTPSKGAFAKELAKKVKK